MKTFVCPDCGKEIEVENIKNRKRCNECAKEHARKIKNFKQRARRRAKRKDQEMQGLGIVPICKVVSEATKKGVSYGVYVASYMG